MWGTTMWGTCMWGTCMWGTSMWGTSMWGISMWGTSMWGTCMWGTSMWQKQPTASAQNYRGADKLHRLRFSCISLFQISVTNNYTLSFSFLKISKKWGINISIFREGDKHVLQYLYSGNRLLNDLVGPDATKRKGEFLRNFPSK